MYLLFDVGYVSKDGDSSLKIKHTWGLGAARILLHGYLGIGHCKEMRKITGHMDILDSNSPTLGSVFARPRVFATTCVFA